jgi:hypothetical protein
MFFKLNLQIDIDKARRYYSMLESNYQHKKWESLIGNKLIYGWSIHVLQGVTDNFGFYGINTEPCGVEKYYRSEVCFDWAEEILDLFQYGYRAGVGVNPPGTIVPPHIDENCNEMMRLHIPIHTNKDYVWHTHLPDLHMEAGSVYLVDTSNTHATSNNGETNRVHFGMNIPRTNFNDIKKFLL